MPLIDVCPLAELPPGAIRRVETMDPEMLPTPQEAVNVEQKRGAAKKDTLLQYLRHHPEELRPIEPPPER